jgi:pimeloyl-ACP methyl ester carboxylesterase
MSDLPLPSFLSYVRRLPADEDKCTPIESVFDHGNTFGPSQTFWWAPTNSTSTNSRPNTVLVFIPGNPGLAAFYIPFLSAIHYSASQALNSSSFAILAHTHLGHHKFSGSDTIANTWPKSAHVELDAQTEALIQVVDAIRAEYGEETRVILAGHSMGSFLALQVLKARPDALSGLFLLFPTITNIADTPNGTALSVRIRLPSL